MPSVTEEHQSSEPVTTLADQDIGIDESEPVLPEAGAEVGTWASMGLGCIAATGVLIVFALVMLVLSLVLS